MQIAYTVLIVLDMDDEELEDSAGGPWRELIAQLRLAAHDLTVEGTPEPGEATCLRRDDRAVVYLSSADLTPNPPHTVVPDPWLNPDAASAHQPPPF